MTTIELNAKLQREIRAIANDEDLLRQAINAIKSLRQGKNSTHPEPPCCYTVEEVKERALSAIHRYEQGDYLTNQEVISRTDRWK